MSANCHLLHDNQEKQNHNKREITSKRTVNILNTNTDKIGNLISHFSNYENWQIILTGKKYIHNEKHQMSKQKLCLACNRQI